jgi:hypothetical protein
VFNKAFYGDVKNSTHCTKVSKDIGQKTAPEK